MTVGVSDSGSALLGCDAAKWQAERCVAPIRVSEGSSSKQRPNATGQRGLKLQPRGGLAALGASPVSGVRRRLRSIAGSGIGTASSSPRV